MTQTPETPNDRIDRLEATLSRFAELSFQSYRQHDEALSRLEGNVARLEAATERNALSIFELKGIMVNLATQQEQTTHSLDALTQTQTECLQLIATNTVEINRIWQYLERQTGNGRSGEQP